MRFGDATPAILGDACTGNASAPAMSSGRGWTPDPLHVRPDSLLNAVMRVWPGAAITPGEVPPPPEYLVQRLATALCTPRPWMRFADPVKARRYFEARARHMLSGALEPAAVVEREERLRVGQGAAT